MGQHGNPAVREIRQVGAWMQGPSISGLSYTGAKTAETGTDIHMIQSRLGSKRKERKESKERKGENRYLDHLAL